MRRFYFPKQNWFSSLSIIGAASERVSTVLALVSVSIQNAASLLEAHCDIKAFACVSASL